MCASITAIAVSLSIIVVDRDDFVDSISTVAERVRGCTLCRLAAAAVLRTLKCGAAMLLHRPLECRDAVPTGNVLRLVAASGIKVM